MVVLGGKIPGRKTAAAGNPDRRMRLLNRPRPYIHHRQFEVLAVPRENLGRLPRLHNEVVRLVVALALLDRRDSVAQVHVLRRPQRHPGHQAAAADAIDHRVLFGDSYRRIRRRKRRPHLHDGDVGAVSCARENRPHQVGIRHEAVCVLMMLVDADAVDSLVGRMN